MRKVTIDMSKLTNREIVVTEGLEYEVLATGIEAEQMLADEIGMPLALIQQYRKDDFDVETLIAIYDDEGDLVFVSENDVAK